MSPAAAARSILIKSGSVLLEPETEAPCDGVALHLPDPHGGLLLPAAADDLLALEVRKRQEVPAIALLVDVPSLPATRRPLPRLQLTGWLSLADEHSWHDAGGRQLGSAETVLQLDPQIVVLVTDYGSVQVDLDDYQQLSAESLPGYRVK